MADSQQLRDRIDELLDFLPGFASGDRDIIHWGGGETLPNGAMTMHFPIYADDVEKFMRLASQAYWCDYDYIPNQASAMLNDEALIATANLAQIKTMLTYIVRGERFCDGHWQAMMRSGRVTALLQRLQAIRATLPSVS